MTPLELILTLCALTLVLVAAEAVLPTHGVLGIMGMACAAVAVGVCFYVNRWLGLGVLLAGIIATPILATVFLNVWPRTNLGRRIFLPTTTTVPLPPPVYIGQVGVTRAALRPGGEVEFLKESLDPAGEPACIEAVSEHGLIPAGTRVKVVALIEGKPRVRPLT
jgi:membrane-bound ClpP family serine protease